jgi:GNAT superfamily N-acetyltransferase
MDVVIRPAQPEDARAIVAVAAEVWPEEWLDPAFIAGLIGEGGRATLLAELGGRVVGFVDGFATRTGDGRVRWEVDLLAVSPSAQGQGIGRQLVRASVTAGARGDAELTRGLVRVGNLASERVFAACGFLPDRDVCELWTGEGLRTDAPGGMHIVPVWTFRYAGNWLEEVTAAGLRALQPNGTSDMAGTLIPVTDTAALEAAASANLTASGRYRFWRRSVSVGRVE